MKDFLFSDVAIIKGELYFYSAKYGILEKIDSLGKAELIFTSPQKYNPVEIIAFEDRLFALDVSGRYILNYDVNSKQFKTIDIDCNDREWGNFLDFFVYKDRVYIIPKYRDKILVLNPFDDHIECNDLFVSNREECVGCYNQDEYWFLSKNGGKATVVDLSTFKSQDIELPEKGKSIIRCRSFEDIIYILEKNGKVYFWDKHERIMKIYYSGESSVEFSDIVVTSNGTYLLPTKQDEGIWKVNVPDNSLNRLNNEPKDLIYDAPFEWSAFLGFTQTETEVVFAMRSTNYMLMINKNNGSVEWRKVYPISEDQATLENFMRGGTIMNESDIDEGLRNFVERLCE